MAKTLVFSTKQGVLEYPTTALPDATQFAPYTYGFTMDKWWWTESGKRMIPNRLNNVWEPIDDNWVPRELRMQAILLT